MAKATTTSVVDSSTLAAYLEPRDDFVGETITSDATSDGSTATTFGMAEGPFNFYERIVSSEAAGNNTYRLTETTTFSVATPFWSILLTPALLWEFKRKRPGPRTPWWAPPDRFDARTARTMSYLCVLTVISGYLGVLIGQTLTFAADEFMASNKVQGIVLSATRIGTGIAAVVAALSDTHGRRRFLLGASVAGVLFTIVTAASFGIASLAVVQAVARGCATAMAILIGVMAAEAVPKGSRAYAAGVLILTAGLGSGIPIWFLWVADQGVQAWRVLYVIPVLALPVIWWVSRSLEETERFEAFQQHQPQVTASTGGRFNLYRAITGADGQKGTIDWRRFWLVAGAGFLGSAFASPASQFRNDFLRDERGFDGAQITPFTLLTNTPVGIGVAIAGKWADRRGRRRIGAAAVTGGAFFLVLMYSVSGPGMWVASILASVIGAMAGPALGVYSAELFSTGNRGRANGLIQVVSVTGSVAGLLFVGWVSDSYGYGRAFLLLAILPALLVLLVWFRYPETAKTELEDLNPDDRPT